MIVLLCVLARQVDGVDVGEVRLVDRDYLHVVEQLFWSMPPDEKLNMLTVQTKASALEPKRSNRPTA